MSRLNIYSKEQIDTNVGSSEDTASASGTLWARLKNAVARITGLESADAQNVKLTGAQTIAGQKTMSDSPIVPTTPTTPTGAVNSVYVNDATDGVNNIVHKSGNETIGGTKFFMASIGQLYVASPFAYIYTNWSIDSETTQFKELLSVYDNNNSEIAVLFIEINNGATALKIRVRNADGTSKTITLAEGNP